MSERDYSQEFGPLKIKMIKDSEYIKHKRNRTKLIRYIAIYTSIFVIIAGLISWLLLTDKTSKLYEIVFCIFSSVFGIIGIMFGVIIGKKHI